MAIFRKRSHLEQEQMWFEPWTKGWKSPAIPLSHLAQQNISKGIHFWFFFQVLRFLLANASLLIFFLCWPAKVYFFVFHQFFTLNVKKMWKYINVIQHLMVEYCWLYFRFFHWLSWWCHPSCMTYLITGLTSSFHSLSSIASNLLPSFPQ